MAVERRFVGVGGLGDRVDADSVNPVSVEQLAGGPEDSRARRRRRLCSRVRSCHFGGHW